MMTLSIQDLCTLSGDEVHSLHHHCTEGSCPRTGSGGFRPPSVRP